ncbi:hypothetical protein CCY99_07320 [Helicobacter sp. 16-1353]|nr:hypothetical protein CCY99_07320 [Helicobacter sp. 16-1353]
MVAIYGDVAYKLDENSLKIPKKYANPKYRMPFCHQAVFVKTSLLKKYKFDTSFKICADNDFFTKIYHLGYKFHKVEQIISLYDAYGVSSRPNLRFFYEELKIAQKYNKFYFLIFIPKYLFMVLKYAIKSLLPRKLSILIQKNYNAK